jgi:hypothetical protein
VTDEARTRARNGHKPRARVGAPSSTPR